MLQELPRAAKSCQELPRAAKSCQEQPRAAKKSQELPRAKKSSQVLSRAAKSSKKVPRAAKCFQELWRASKNSKKFLGDSPWEQYRWGQFSFNLKIYLNVEHPKVQLKLDIILTLKVCLKENNFQSLKNLTRTFQISKNILHFSQLSVYYWKEFQSCFCEDLFFKTCS